MPKGTPIHVHLLDAPDVKRFAEVAERVCDVFERLDELSKIDFLHQLKDLLPLVYHLGLRIPDPYDWPDDDDEERDDEDEDSESGDHDPWPRGMSDRERSQRSKQLHERIIAKLSWHSIAHVVYDPVSAHDREAIPLDLGRILADAYIDLKSGLLLYSRSANEDRAQALWDWSFNIGIGWGHDVAVAMLPIHSLIHDHYDEDEERFRYD